MTVNGFTPRDYAAQINNVTTITRAYKRENAVTFLQAKDPSLKDADVYAYKGISSAGTIDEVYCEEESKWDDKERCIVRKDVYKVRMKEEYADLVNA